VASRRKKRVEEHPDERWLVTYADVLTLMFVLFMVLFSISVVNTSKFDLLKETLQDAFSSGLISGGERVLPEVADATPAPVVDIPASRIAPEVPTIGGISLGAASPEQALETSQLEAAQRTIDAKVADAGLERSVTTAVNERGLSVRLQTDGVLFDSGSATLRPDGARILTPIAASLRKLPNPVRVEGHTDSNPIATAQFPSNWELSGARASAVVRTFEAGGIPASRLQFAGFGDNRPAADNASEAGRAENRRIEVLVLRLQGAPGQSPAAALGG
jgi:chemotaxis protein MotB